MVKSGIPTRWAARVPRRWCSSPAAAVALVWVLHGCVEGPAQVEPAEVCTYKGRGLAFSRPASDFGAIGLPTVVTELLGLNDKSHDDVSGTVLRMELTGSDRFRFRFGWGDFWKGPGSHEVNARIRDAGTLLTTEIEFRPSPGSDLSEATLDAWGGNEFEYCGTGSPARLLLRGRSQ